MVDDPVLLEPVGAPLVRPLTRTNLTTPNFVLGHGAGCRRGSLDLCPHGLIGKPVAVLARACLCRLGDPRRHMCQPAACLNLVSILAAGATPREIARAKVSLDQPWNDRSLQGISNCNGHSRAVHAAAPLIGWNALDAVPSDLMVEAVAAISFKLDDDSGLVCRALTQFIRASASTLCTGEAQISIGKLGNEQTSVVAAFASANFYDAFGHDWCLDQKGRRARSRITRSELRQTGPAVRIEFILNLIPDIREKGKSKRTHCMTPCVDPTGEIAYTSYHTMW